MSTTQQHTSYWKEFVSRIPIAFARQHGVLGFTPEKQALPLWISQASNTEILDNIRRIFRRPLDVIEVTEEELQHAINQAYELHTTTAKELLTNWELVIETADEREDLLDSQKHAPVIRLVNTILLEAIQQGVSDIHIQPNEGKFVARFRRDGVLFDAIDIPKHLQEEVLSRIKILGGMDIAEKRLPQDGRATVRVANKIIDLRIASLPTSHQERIVIRLLDKSLKRYTLDDLGMPLGTQLVFRKLIELEHGLILVTGPTGSGKSTTLYAALQELNTTELNILTLEDPIEYELRGISQTQTNDKKGLTFARGLRSILRQDPDVIMVGEIRDHETAELAIQASMTGHLVFSTLHTNDAASAITRLLDLEIEPFLVASSLQAVLAQRLVRKLCPNCKTIVDLPSKIPDWLQSNAAEKLSLIYDAQGCETCRQTGFQGRIGLFELLLVDHTCRELIQTQAHALKIREAAIAQGMKLLTQSGGEKVRQGITSLPEILRVSQLSLDDY